MKTGNAILIVFFLLIILIAVGFGAYYMYEKYHLTLSKLEKCVEALK
jgi:hypothetical protein